MELNRIADGGNCPGFATGSLDAANIRCMTDIPGLTQGGGNRPPHTRNAALHNELQEGYDRTTELPKDLRPRHFRVLPLLRAATIAFRTKYPMVQPEPSSACGCRARDKTTRATPTQGEPEVPPLPIVCRVWNRKRIPSMFPFLSKVGYSK